MDIFSKEKFIEVNGQSEYDRLYRWPTNGKNWVDQCDGKEVKDGYCFANGPNRMPYLIAPYWIVKVKDKGGQAYERDKDIQKRTGRGGGG